jgi:hypothetical protein
MFSQIGPSRMAFPRRGNSYSIFCRIADYVSFVESTDTCQKALQRLRALSLEQSSEFVLFYKLHVIAACQRGVVQLRQP